MATLPRPCAGTFISHRMNSSFMIAPRARRAFTLIEILIVVAIIALLAAILFPVFSRVRESARRTSCASNLKQLALGMIQYAQDYDERLPEAKPSSIYVNVSDQSQSSSAPSGCTSSAGQASPTPCVQWFWPDLIYPYVKNAQVYNDPSGINQYFDGCQYSDSSSPYQDVACDTPAVVKPWVYQGPLESALDLNTTSNKPYRRGRDSIAYGYAQRIGDLVYRLSASADTDYGLTNGNIAGLVNPSETLLISENASYLAKVPGNESNGRRSGDLIPRHLEGLNVAFADGHVKWMKWNDVSAHPVWQNDTNGLPEPAPTASEATRKLWLPDYSG